MVVVYWYVLSIYLSIYLCARSTKRVFGVVGLGEERRRRRRRMREERGERRGEEMTQMG